MFKPDLANYLDRIQSLQQGAAPDSEINPSQSRGAATHRFWVTSAGRNIVVKRETAGGELWTFVVEMFLSAGPRESNAIAEVERQVLVDLPTVAYHFWDHADLTNETYPAVQPGFVPTSAMLLPRGRVEYTTQSGLYVGSLYDLSWQHRVTK